MFDKSKNMSRRKFIKTAGAAGLGSALGALGSAAPSQASEPKTVPTRPFGKTGVNVATLALGGELRAYTELLTEARREAVERMIAQADSLGANAIVNVRFTTSSVAGGAAELYSYGTAVTVA